MGALKFRGLIFKACFILMISILFISCLCKDKIKSLQYYKAGEQLFIQTNYLSAEKMIKESISYCKTNWKAKHLLGKIYIKTQKYGNAFKILEAIQKQNITYYSNAKVNKDMANIFFQIGYIEFNKQQRSPTLEYELDPIFFGSYFSDAEEYDPENIEIKYYGLLTDEYTLYAGRYSKEFQSTIDQLEIVMNKYKALIQKHPDYWDTYFRIGYYYLNYKEDINKAESYLLKAYNLKKNDPQLLFYLSKFYRLKGNKQLSEQYFKQSKALDPKIEKRISRWEKIFHFTQ